MCRCFHSPRILVFFARPKQKGVEIRRRDGLYPTKGCGYVDLSNCLFLRLYPVCQTMACITVKRLLFAAVPVLYAATRVSVEAINPTWICQPPTATYSTDAALMSYLSAPSSASYSLTCLCPSDPAGPGTSPVLSTVVFFNGSVSSTVGLPAQQCAWYGLNRTIDTLSATDTGNGFAYHFVLPSSTTAASSSEFVSLQVAYGGTPVLWNLPSSGDPVWAAATGIRPPSGIGVLEARVVVDAYASWALQSRQDIAVGSVALPSGLFPVRFSQVTLAFDASDEVYLLGATIPNAATNQMMLQAFTQTRGTASLATWAILYGQ
jgi:hypothetical protein